MGRAQASLGTSTHAHTFRQARAFNGFAYDEAPASVAQHGVTSSIRAFAGEPGQASGSSQSRTLAAAGAASVVHGPRRFERTFSEAKLRADQATPSSSSQAGQAGQSQGQTQQHGGESATDDLQPSMELSWQRTFTDPRFIVPGNNKKSYKTQWLNDQATRGEQIKLEEGAKTSQWYPHPSLQRGHLILSRPRALAYGIDPQKWKVQQDPFFNADHHRFKGVVDANPSSQPELHGYTKKWHSQEAYENPRYQAHYKVASRPPAGYDRPDATLPRLPED